LKMPTRTNTALLHPSPSEEGELHRLSEASARLWNRANYQRRQAFFDNRRTPSYPYQCNYFKDDLDFRLLGTCRAQALLQKLAEEYVIKVSTVDESYTSLLCSLCGKKHRNGRIERGLYYCSTYQRYINADVNGAMNVLRRVAATPARASGSGLADGAALASEVGWMQVGG